MKKLMIFQVQKPLRFFVSGTNLLGRGSKIRYQRKEFKKMGSQFGTLFFDVDCHSVVE